MNLAAQDLIKVPRTCVVCRKVDEKNRLLRIVHHEEVVFDFAQVLLGRGLYVHCSERCLEEKRLVNTLSKLKKNRSVGGKSRVVAETSLRVDDDRSSRKSSQISLDSLVEGGGRCLELLDVSGSNSKKFLLAKKIFEQTKEIVLLSSKPKQIEKAFKKRPLRL